MRKYDTVIIGGGFFSCGYAAAHKNTLILEASQMLDKTYYGTLRGFESENLLPQTQNSISLCNCFNTLGVLKDNMLYVNALDVALCNFISDDIPDILLGTKCTEIKKEADLFLISYVNNEGRGLAYAEKVIVCTQPKGDFLNVLIEHTAPLPSIFQSRKAFFENQSVITLYLPNEENVNSAKVTAYNYLARCLPENTMVLHMGTFTYSEPQAPYVDQIGVLHIDEFYFGSPIASYAKGETI